jgi:hypothetical protein
MEQNWQIEDGWAGDKLVPFLTHDGRDGIRLDEEAAAFLRPLLQDRNTNTYQQHYRKQVKLDLLRKGFVPSEDAQTETDLDNNLQWLWRKAGCRRDPSEIMLAILDALTQEGVAAWPGDATSCVEQIVRVQYDRAEKARKDTLEEAAQKIEKLMEHSPQYDRELLAKAIREL